MHHPSLFLGLFSVLVAPLCAQTLPYLYALEGSGPSSLIRLDPATGQRLQVMSVSSTYSFALARDGQNLLSTDFTPSSFTRIDPFSGAKTVLGPLAATNFKGLEVDPTDGKAYMSVDANFGLQNDLYAVNKSNGALTLIGSLTLPGAQATAMAIDSQGKAYLVSGGFGQSFQLWKVNLTNAALTLVGTITGTPAQSRFDDLAFDHLDVLHALHRPSGGVYRLDTTTAVATFLFDTGNYSSIAFLTTCPNNPAAWSNYGAGWPGTAGIPALTAANPPRLGAPIVLNLGNSLGTATQGALFVGVTPAALATPFGGTLLVNILTSLTVPVPAPGASLTFSIPNDPSGCGVSVYFQGVEIDAGASQGISFSPGLRLDLGS